MYEVTAGTATTVNELRAWERQAGKLDFFFPFLLSLVVWAIICAAGPLALLCRPSDRRPWHGILGDCKTRLAVGQARVDYPKNESSMGRSFCRAQLLSLLKLSKQAQYCTPLICTWCSEIPILQATASIAPNPTPRLLMRQVRDTARHQMAIYLLRMLVHKTWSPAFHI
ncbi:hypothetical protein EV126DRAFT_25407 [Verticillium dahliae]|nr:hypothetical protein EV126DRAFT_25407 [Verticillium dahliae]